ncbi:MAG TPA: DUF885 family protein [Chthoniobacterales bacterium]|nr:DUF885 family protein [Chthoniobacterales bacterium]
MRLRPLVFSLALCLPFWCVAAAPSPSPALKPSATPAKKPAPKPSPTPVAALPPKPTPTPKASTTPKASPTPKSSPTPKPTPALKPDAELDNVADEFVRGYLSARPLQASALGFHEYDGRISEYTRLAIDAELARLKRFDERLKKFDVAKLGPRAAIDLRLLQAAIKKELFFLHDLAIYEQNPMSYARAIDVNIYAKRKYAPIDDRVRSIIVVENQAPNVMIAAKTNLAEVLPKPYVELAIQIARGSSDFLKKNLADALAELKDESLRAAFIQSNRRAATALADYAAWLEKEKLPKATPQFAIGEEKYRRFLAQTELVELPPAKILDLGLLELQRERDVFAEAAKKIDPEKSAAEVFRQIQNEYPAADDLIPEITKKLDSIRKFVVDHKLVTIPTEVRAQVKETPQHLRPISFASMDAPGPYEKRATEAYFYITPPENEWPEHQKNEWLTAFNPYSADLISMYETYPGHYVQSLRLNASKATRPEKIFGSISYIEGWAHYCEKMMIDAGFGSAYGPNPTDEEIRHAAKYRMAQAQLAMLRLGRLCVSIKMHTQGMSVEDAAKFLQENCYSEEKLAVTEAMRGTFDLGSLNDTLGKLQILKLRKDYEIQEGENFSLKKFHDELLNHGMLPIRLLREVMLKDAAKWEEIL